MTLLKFLDDIHYFSYEIPHVTNLFSIADLLVERPKRNPVFKLHQGDFSCSVLRNYLQTKRQIVKKKPETKDSGLNINKPRDRRDVSCLHYYCGPF